MRARFTGHMPEPIADTPVIFSGAGNIPISVITVRSNVADTITEILDLMGYIAYPLVDHILVDDGYSDGTPAIVDRHTLHRAKQISEPDRGIYDARSKVVSMASGETAGTSNADGLNRIAPTNLVQCELQMNAARDTTLRHVSQFVRDFVSIARYCLSNHGHT